METCRACLVTNQELVPLDEDFVNAYNLLTNLNIALLDAMPQYVCQSCVQNVKHYIEFRKRCIQSENSLQEIVSKRIKAEIKNEKNACKELKIKIEPIEETCEYLDDDFQDFDDDMLLISIKEEKDNEEADIPKKKYIKKTAPKIKKKKTTLKEKIAAVVKVEKLPCGLCKQHFSAKEELKTHVESHKPNLKCDLCAEKGYNFPNLVGHRFTHVSKDDYKCHVCWRTLTNPYYMENHYRNDHFDGKKEPLSCKLCTHTFDNARNLMKHISWKHTKEDVSFICDHCSKVYATKGQLSAHIRKSHGIKKTFVCDACGYSCFSSQNLLQHKIKRHVPSRILCKKCNRAFLTQEEFAKHTCNGVSKICPVCGKEVKGKFTDHMNRHKGIDSYKCPRCPAGFATKNSLVAHINRHDGIKPHKCEFCTFQSYTRCVLIKHRRTHTGEKPFVCKVCNKGFTANYNLKIHMKVHGEFNLVVKKIKPEDLPFDKP